MSFEQTLNRGYCHRIQKTRRRRRELRAAQDNFGQRPKDNFGQRPKDNFVKQKILILAIATATTTLSCKATDNQSCQDTCSVGQVCDTSLGICVDEPRDGFEGDIPGRSVQLATANGKVFVAMVDPVGRRVVAGELTPESSTLHELGVSSSAQSKVVIRVSNTRVYVAWLATNGAYRFASREFATPNANWAIEEIELPDNTYEGSEEFDFVVGEEVGVYVAFQTRDRRLSLLSRDNATNAFRLEQVDDGSPSSNGIACPDSLRSTEAPAGIGVNPSIALNQAGIAIAYQDADCGDLRLARRAVDGFSVDVVDTGSLDGEPIPGRRGRVGKYASARYEPDSGRLFIAYLDETRARVMLAITNDSGGYDLEVVDRGDTLDSFARQRKDLVGSFITLSFGPRDEPSISHMNTTKTTIRFSQRPSGGGLWFHQTIADEGVVGFSASHVYADQIGLVSAAERLVPAEGGFASELEVIWP